MEQSLTELCRATREKALRGDGLTSAEAKLILDHFDNIKLTHGFFTDDEWICGSPKDTVTSTYISEDGIVWTAEEFWYFETKGVPCRYDPLTRS